jgi:hypothetical protein
MPRRKFEQVTSAGRGGALEAALDDGFGKGKYWKSPNIPEHKFA